MQVGEGRTRGGARGSDTAVSIRPNMLIAPNTLPALIADIYGEISFMHVSPIYLTQRAILAPRNVDVEMINNQVLDMLPGGVSFFCLSHLFATLLN